MSEQDHPAEEQQQPASKGLGLEPVEQPRSGKGKRLPWLVLAAALVLAGAAGVWLYGDLNRPPAEAPAPPAAAPAPRDYMTQIPAVPPAPKAEPEAAPPAQAQPQAAPRAPDGREVVEADFVTDLARYAASRYHPAGSRDNDKAHGISTLTFKSLNMRYGTELTGLKHEDPDLEAAREEIFSALMHPIILRVVFDLYADDFSAALAREARSQTRDFTTASGFQAKPLSETHVAEALRITARQTRDLGGVFESFARRPDLADGVMRYFSASDRVNAAYGAYADVEAAGAGADTLDASAETIKQAIKERERLKAAVLAGLRTKDSGLSDGQILDVATWIARRLKGHPGRIHSIGAIASLSRELAQKLEAAPAARPGD